MRRLRGALLTCAVLITCGDLLAAETAPEASSELLVASIFADPSIVAPVVEWRGRRGDGSSYRYGLSGWTLNGERTWRMTPSRSLIVSVDATPIHAHNSNRIFIAGERAQFLEYSNASYRLRSGFRLTPTAHNTTELQASLLYERVSGVEPCPTQPFPDRLTSRAVSSMCGEALEDRWRRPYAGLEVAHTWSRTGNGNPLISSLEGFEVTARAEAMAGSRSWARASLVESGGRNLGRWHVSHAASVFYGSRLDRVNRFLLGGSWDALGGAAVYGYRYAEFRVRRAATAGGGVDYRLPGTWRAGLRLSCTDNDIARTCGTALNVSMTWRTVGVSGGIGQPAHRSGAEAPRIAYVAAIIPLRQR